MSDPAAIRRPAPAVYRVWRFAPAANGQVEVLYDVGLKSMTLPAPANADRQLATVTLSDKSGVQQTLQARLVVRARRVPL